MPGLFDDLPRDHPDELVTTLLERTCLRVERIVSRGHCSPPGFWYDQEEGEWVAVLRGAARLAFEDGSVVDLGPGDHVDIPPHRRHRVEWTDPADPTVWLAVFYRS